MSMPSNEMPQPHWKAAVSTPKAAAAREEVGDRRLQRDQQRAERDHQQRGSRAGCTVADHQQQPRGDQRGQVDVRRGGAADVGRDAASPAVASGITVSRTSSTRSAVSSDGRRGRRRRAESSTTSPRLVDLRRRQGDARRAVADRPSWRFDDPRVGAARVAAGRGELMSVSCVLELLGLLLLLLGLLLLGLEVVGLLPAGRRACGLELVALRAAARRACGLRARRPARWSSARLLLSCGLLPLQLVGLALQLGRPAAAAGRPAPRAAAACVGELAAPRARAAAQLGRATLDLPRSRTVGEPGPRAARPDRRRPSARCDAALEARARGPRAGRSSRASGRLARRRVACGLPPQGSRLGLQPRRSRLEPALLGLSAAASAARARPAAAWSCVGLALERRPAALSSSACSALERLPAAASSCCLLLLELLLLLRQLLLLLLELGPAATCALSYLLGVRGARRGQRVERRTRPAGGRCSPTRSRR